MQSILRTVWGFKSIVNADVIAPDGNPMHLTTGWIARNGEPPSLVTAYPRRLRR